MISGVVRGAGHHIRMLFQRRFDRACLFGDMVGHVLQEIGLRLQGAADALAVAFAHLRRVVQFLRLQAHGGGNFLDPLGRDLNRGR